MKSKWGGKRPGSGRKRGVMNTNNPLLEFQMELRGMTAKQIANLLTEYVMESNHNGWDGWESHHLTGVRALFRDIMLYYRHALEMEDGPGSKRFNGDPPHNGVQYAYKKDETGE